MAICAFIQLPYVDDMLNYHLRTPERLMEHRERRRPDGTILVSHEGRLQQQALTTQPPQISRVGAWREQMAEDERVRFDAAAGDLLLELGYVGDACSYPGAFTTGAII
jgi:hypothetical protein